MNKQDKLEILLLLSALESWGFAEKHCLPDYLQDRIGTTIELLSKEVLEDGSP